MKHNLRKVVIFGLLIIAMMLVMGYGGSSSASPTSTPAESTEIPAPVTLPTIPEPAGTSYYVATNGSNSNPGTKILPFAKISYAVSKMTAGDCLYVRGGTYNNETATIYLNGVGTDTSRYYITAYQNEHPVIDFVHKGGFHIKGNYWVIQGLEAIHGAKYGMRIGVESGTGGGNYNIIKNCSFHDNRDSGLFIGLSKGTSLNTDGSRAAHNWVIRCDSYLNFDPSGSTGVGGNADGFSCKLNPGKGNIFYGCRSWENSDDGWDLYMANFRVIMENCWTWHNGDANSSYSDTYTGTFAGNGQGFKVGGGSASKTNEFVSHGAHVLRNCIAFNAKYGKSTRAFDRNNNMAGITMLNCVAWGSTVGFYFSTDPNNGTFHTLRNCVIFDCTTDVSLSGNTVHDHNSWDISGLTASSGDFADISESAAKAPRGADGSLPTGFARLVSTSALIDKGVNVGAAYLGVAPDLGAFEKK